MEQVIPLPQISAHVSEGTKNKLDHLTRERGLRKAYVMEQALLYYFRALEELPGEALLPARLVLSTDAFQRVLNTIDNPPPPTPAMLELMNADIDSIVTEK